MIKLSTLFADVLQTCGLGFLAELTEQNHETSQALGSNVCEAIAVIAWLWSSYREPWQKKDRFAVDKVTVSV